MDHCSKIFVHFNSFVATNIQIFYSRCLVSDAFLGIYLEFHTGILLPQIQKYRQHDDKTGAYYMNPMISLCFLISISQSWVDILSRNDYFAKVLVLVDHMAGQKSAPLPLSRLSFSPNPLKIGKILTQKGIFFKNS